MELFIKNMVCARCIKSVEGIMKQHNLTVTNMGLGKVELKEATLEKNVMESIRTQLAESGFELMSDKKGQLISRIKSVIIDLVHYLEPINVKYSIYIEEQVGEEYDQLSRLFSDTEGITIEQYIILQKIERVKELLVYGEHTLTQIANEMDYSSAAHLSAQFKKITGLTPSFFRKKGGGRKMLDIL